MNTVLRHLGRVDYQDTDAAMQAFTAQRGADAADELWLCEHPAVYTQGISGSPVAAPDGSGIPVVQTNRGGKLTFHGPGQVVAYPLMDLRRAGYFVKEYVYRIEESVIRTLAHFGVTGHRVAGAPGIYVRLDDPGSHQALAQRPQRQVPGERTPPTPDFSGLGKISALGVKVSRHCSLHGVALNVAMDLSPFERINPCGYVGLRTVDLSTIGVHTTWEEAADVLSHQLIVRLAP